jgi:hypothetical protein
MKRLAGLGLVSALGFGLLTTLPVQAGPFGVIAGVEITSATSDSAGAIHPVQYYRGPQEYPPALFNQGGEAGRPPPGFFQGNRPGYTPDYDPTPRYRTAPRYREYRTYREYPTYQEYPAYRPQPRYYGGPSYYYPEPRRRGRTTRDPAGGGTLR